jgi:CxxC motif-containing protein
VNEQDLICIVCPAGCELEVSGDGNEWQVRHNRCAKGIDYARKEVFAPERELTSTVALRGSALEKRLPVRLDRPIARGLILPVVAVIREAVAQVPVEMGDLVLGDVLGLGVNVIASRSVRE